MSLWTHLTTHLADNYAYVCFEIKEILTMGDHQLLDCVWKQKNKKIDNLSTFFITFIQKAFAQCVKRLIENMTGTNL